MAVIGVTTKTPTEFNATQSFAVWIRKIGDSYQKLKIQLEFFFFITKKQKKTRKLMNGT